MNTATLNTMPDTAFDPDAYLASKPAVPAFDPDAYLKTAHTGGTQSGAAFDPTAYLQGGIDQMAADKSFDPVAYYAANQNKEAMDTAREVFKRRAAQPTNFGQTAMDTVKAIPGGAWNAVSGMVKGTGHAIANVATELVEPEGSAEAQRAQRENAAAIQAGAMQGGDLIHGGWRNLQRLFGKTDRTLSDAEIEDQIRHDAAHRAVQQHLMQGNVVEGGLGEQLGFGSVQRNTLTPEELQQKNAPINPQDVENESFLGNPATYAVAPVGEVVGPAVGKFVTAPVLKTAGKLATGTGEAVSSLLSRTHATPVSFLHGLWSHNPMVPAATFSAKVAAEHVLPPAGRLLTEAGEEAAGAAPQVGQNLASKMVKSAAQGAVTGTAMSAPFVAAAQSPEEAGQAIGGGFGLGAALGAAGGVINSRKIDTAAKFGQLADEGSRINYGLGYDEAHNTAMAQLSPQDQATINAYRGRFNGMTDKNGMPIQIYAASGPDYVKALAENGGGTATDSRGFISQDGTKVFVNADAANVPGKTDVTLGHEAGGHISEFLGDIAQANDVASLQESIRSALYNNGKPTPQFEAFMRNYKSDLLGSGAAQAQIDALSSNYFEREFLAQHAAKILSGESIASFHLPKPISERIVRGASDWLRAQGILPKEGGEVGWGANEVKNITSQLRDVLYNQGQQSENLRASRAESGAPSPSVDYRLQQLRTILDQPQRQGITIDELNQRQAAQKEYDALIKAQQPANGKFPAAGRPPTAPSAPTVPPTAPTEPTAPTSRMGDIPRVAAYLRQQGIPAAEALQWASVAEGNTIEEKVVDAIRKRGQQKFPNAQSPAPAPNEPLPAQPQQGKQINPVATETAPQVGTTAQVAMEPVAPRPVKTAEEVGAMVDAARSEATAKEKKPSTKAAQERIQRSVVDAILNDIGDSQGLHKETDAFGNERITGDYDPTDPRHKALADLGGLSDADAAKIQNAQQNKGSIQYIRYRSALSNLENEGERPYTGMDTRRAEYELDPTATRTEGTIQHKVMIPIGTQMHSPSGRMTLQFVVLDNILHNAASIFDGLKEIGRPNPYGDTPSKQEPLLVRDAQAYADNHAHGYKGDGSGPASRFPDSGLPSVDPDYSPVPIPADRFAVLNMAFHNEAAGKLSAINDRVALYEANGKQVPKSVLAQQAKAQEMHALASENSPWVDQQTGETNQLRAEMKAAGFDTDVRMKSPFETLSPKHILETSDQPIPLQEGDIPTVRPTGFSVDPAELGRKGYPQNKAVGAGFMPGEPKGEDYAKLENTTSVDVLNALARRYGVPEEQIKEAWNDYGVGHLRDLIRSQMDSAKSEQPIKSAAKPTAINYKQIADDIYDRSLQHENTPIGKAPSAEMEDKLRERATAMTQKTGFPSNSIADLIEGAGFKSMEEAKGALMSLWKQGKVQFGLGDWSLSSPREKAWAVLSHRGDKQTLVEFLPPKKSPKELARERIAAREKAEK